MFGALKDENLVLWCVFIYLAVFFSPGDLFYQLVTVKAIYVPICVIKEIYRAKKIFAGLVDGRAAVPASPYLVPVIVAVLKGNGSAFAAPFARAIRGEWKLDKTELMMPSVTTKACLLGAILMAAFPDKDVIYLGLVGLYLSLKMASVFGVPADPFKPAEDVTFGIVEGLAGSVEKTKTQ